MKKVLVFALAFALAGSVAYANYCARDVVPASTLLVPYVTVSMNGNVPDPSGYTTLFTVTNVSKDAQIIHIVVWNAISTAVLDFDEVLTGYDQWQINFRDMLTGNWGAFDTYLDPNAPANTGNRTPFEWGPDGRTAYAPNHEVALPVPDPTTILPSAGCNMPYDDMTSYVGLFLPGLQAPLFARSHAGCGNRVVRSQFSNDWLSNLTDNPLFFYVTVDVVNACNLQFPFSAGYFSGQTITYKNANVLTGDIVYMNATANFSEAIPAVHIESDMDETLATNFYTEKLTNPDDVIGDHLEPLATALSFRYQNDPAGSVYGIPMTSSILMWKNYTEFNPDDTVNDCGSYMYYAWDMDEHVISRATGCPVSPCSSEEVDPNEFPFETQNVPVTTDNFDLPGKFGWMLVIYPPSYDQPFNDQTPDAVLLGRAYEAWGAYKLNFGSYSAATEAATLANAHCFATQVLPNLGVNYNYSGPNW